MDKKSTVLTAKYDCDLAIAIGKSRFQKQWNNATIKWSALLGRLSESRETYETHADFMHMTKDRQDSIKDIGGFVGGHLREGKRRTGYVECRQILTLDIDFPPVNLWDLVRERIRPAAAACLYSTHKHTPDNPRYRLIMPLDRETSPDEYEAVARKIAGKIGIECFDDSTYQPVRLMYWPSHSRDVEPEFEYIDAPILSADAVLAEYSDWTDVSYWPVSERAQAKQRRMKDRQQNPLEKNGVIGAFCQAYRIPDAIDTFLSDVYEQAGSEDRYTYIAGSTAAGLVVYDDGLFAYSNHSTDPAGGQLCNAFDLVRIHKFGDLDEGSDKTGSRAPSFRAMQEFALNDGKVKAAALDRHRISAADDFADVDDDTGGGNWITRLTYNKAGLIENTRRNLRLILENDENLKSIAFNELADTVEIRGPVPWEHPSRFWRDADDTQLISYVDDHYGVISKCHYSVAFTKVADDRIYHPIRDYFKRLPEWDGVPRADTLLVDYLGAEDTPYVRNVTRKTLCAGYVRVHFPGCKFDHMTVLNGVQGIGKSMLISKLGGEWYSDSLNLSDMDDKTAAEKLQGFWIIEIGELAGMKKADIDKVKAFISRQDDKYRAAFGRRVTPHPRQCIFFGTTNSTDGYLRDTTGNRRYWNVRVTGRGKYKPWDLDTGTVEQIWAETMVIAKKGETLYLPADLEVYAQREQRAAMEQDERMGIVTDYLNMLLPKNWESMDIYARRDYIRDTKDPTRAAGVVRRTAVSNIEIWSECFGKPKEDMKKADSYAISGIMAGMDGWARSEERECRPLYGRQRVYVRTA